MKLYPIFLLFVLGSINFSYAQNGQTANDVIEPYEGHFRPGSNLGYFPPWDDTDLADIAAGNPTKNLDGVGVKTIRPSLTEDFLENWGYESRIDNYQYYFNLDLKELTNIVGFPAPWHQDNAYHCPEYQSEMFANLYTDIWDNGENGTPVNDDNYLALYLYKVVTNYKDYISFWEIWNEPGFDYTGAKGWLPPGAEGNWWDNNPDPCDYKLRAPIQHYVRTLRISYEVIKTLDPDAYITVAGTGFPSFLDAILRNTDNPVDGSVTEDYPLKGGAYFDVMGYHSYPHLDGSLREWNNDIFDFVYFRHSDGAAEGILKRKERFQNVLDNYGYDGNTYPNKLWIITEANLPRETFSPQFAGAGSEEIQKNFMIKAVVQCLKNDIFQYHVFNLAESESYNDADHEFDLMGLYKKISGTTPFNQIVNVEGIAYKTASDLLYQTTYDDGRSSDLNLPDGVKGGAFVQENGQFVYVLWAETTIDGSEEASAVYSFPESLNINTFEELNWDYSQTGQISNISSQNIQLTATPIFLRVSDTNPITAPAPAFTSTVSSGCAPLTIQFNDQSSESTTSWIWSFPGGTPEASFIQNPVITYPSAGTFDVSLTVSNSAGENELTQSNLITISDVPETNFSFSVSDLEAFFYNATDDVDNYLWDFGDNQTSAEENPTHTYTSDGNYMVTLTTSNDCGSFIRTKEVVISAGVVTAPTASFFASTTIGCSGLEVFFNNESSANATDWSWSFPGGIPNASTEENPFVTYDTPGNYSVILVASNTAGTNTFIQTDYIVIEDIPTAEFQPIVSSSMVSFNNQSTGATEFSWNFGDGNTSNEATPTHHYSADGIYTITLTAENECGTSSSSEMVSILTAPTAGFNAVSTSGCAPFLVNFSNQSSQNTTNWAWSFPGGTPSSSTAQNPSVSYAQAGTYSVILVVSNDAGTNTSIQNNYITVNDFPSASFTTSIMDNTVTFTNTSTNATDFSWDLGDGSFSNEMNPIHNYANQGNYTVSLAAENECGTIITTETISITAAPSAGFEADVLTGCTPLTVSFTNQSSQNTEGWSWSFPGGNPSTSTEVNPVITYNTPGAFSVVLNVSNTAGNNTAIQNNYITVQNAPTAEFSSTTDGAMVTFNNVSQDADSYSWDFGDGNFSSTEDPNHTYDEDGTYTVVLHSMNMCGMASLTEEIIISTPPTAGFTSDISQGCAPLTINYSDQSSSNATAWNWSFPGGMPATSNEQNPVVVYNQTGTYSATLEVSNTDGNDLLSQSNTITVSALPIVNFDFNINDATVDFVNNSTDVSTVQWDFGDGNISNALVPSHTYTEDGTYTVFLTATNGCGTSSSSETVVIATAPTAGFISDINQGCAPLTVTYSDQSSNNTNVWNWTFPGGTPATSSEQNPVVVYDQPGTYSATLEVSNDNGNDLLNQSNTIAVNSTPLANFSYNINETTVNFFNNAIDATSLEWQFGDGNSSNENTPSHTYTGAGNYDVLLIATNECGTDTSTQLVSVIFVSTTDLGFLDQLHIFPNPNTGQFVLNLQGAARAEIVLTVYDILGQPLLASKHAFRSGQLSENFDLSDAASGTYLLQLQSDDEVVYRKIVVNK